MTVGVTGTLVAVGCPGVEVTLVDVGVTVGETADVGVSVGVSVWAKDLSG